VSQAAPAWVKTGGMVILAILILSAFAVRSATADPCAEACRSQHNDCRMAAKLLFSGRCDAQLQGCIMQCFAAARANRDRDLREGRDLRDFRDRRGPADMRGPPDFRGPPEAHVPPDMRPGFRGPGPQGPDARGPGLRVPDQRDPDMRGLPRDFRDFRDRNPRGGRSWLGGPLGWRRGF
jgi:hypothetical protein